MARCGARAHRVAEAGHERAPRNHMEGRDALARARAAARPRVAASARPLAGTAATVAPPKTAERAEHGEASATRRGRHSFSRAVRRPGGACAEEERAAAARVRQTESTARGRTGDPAVRGGASAAVSRRHMATGRRSAASRLFRTRSGDAAPAHARYWARLGPEPVAADRAYDGAGSDRAVCCVALCCAAALICAAVYTVTESRPQHSTSMFGI